MRLSNVNITVKDKGLSLLSPNQALPHGKVGVSSAGTDNEVVLIADQAQIADFGTGPLVNALYDAFAGGARVIYAVKATSDITGLIGNITATKTGQGNMAAVGSPLDSYHVIVEILSNGRFNTATFKYSLDGGDTETDAITVPVDGVYAITGTGITLNFSEYATEPDESFKAGDTYEFKTTAPSASINNITTAINALLNSAYTMEYIHVVGPSSSSVWTALDTLAETAVTDKYKYIHFLCEAAGPSAGQTVSEWVQSLITTALSFDSTRVAVSAAIGEIEEVNTSRVVERNAAGIISGRISSIPVMRSPARVRDGALPRVKSIRPAGLSEEQIALLNDAGYITLRTYEGLTGVYITEGRIMAAADSDFQYIELRRVMDKACRNLRQAALQYKHAEADGDLTHLEASLQQVIDNMAGAGEISSGQITIPEQDILGTSTLRVNIRLVPVGIMRNIELEVGFENPYRAS
ncbi:MAG: DUF2586 domain-containing protein [Peptococcaceae bacterium]|nr:DUF2586 domain-containing protein [Peptococcaceae bacterium]MDH7526042.1 DUF2586 domain-containing protein [Peptococcaceae bacterium]